jgi:RNA polymerase sigma-54 factor
VGDLMGGQQSRIGLQLKVAQKQILTPGLVQMVSVLTLNRIELREMINQEVTANPVLEELQDDAPTFEEITHKTESTPASGPAAGEEVHTGDNHDSFQEIDFGSFFDDYLDPGYKSPAGEVSEKPSFENFLSKPSSLSDHLEWQKRLHPRVDTNRRMYKRLWP